MNETNPVKITSQEFSYIEGIYYPTSMYYWKLISASEENSLYFDPELFCWFIQDKHSLLVRSQVTSFDITRLSYLNWYLDSQLIHINCSLLPSHPIISRQLRCNKCLLFGCKCQTTTNLSQHHIESSHIPELLESTDSSETSDSILQEKHLSTLWKTGGLYLLGKTLQSVNESTRNIANKLKNKQSSTIVGIETTQDKVVILNFATFTKSGNTIEIAKGQEGMIRMNHSTLSVLKSGCS